MNFKSRPESGQMKAFWDKNCCNKRFFLRKKISSTFSISCLRYSFFYLTPFWPTFEIHQPPLFTYAHRDEYLIDALLLAVEEDGPSEIDQQVGILHQ